MQFHTIQPKTKHRSRKYIGRGGKRGTTSGRGTKGQKARAGHKIRPEIRDIIKRIPKLRGYRFHGVQKPIFTFTLGAINDYFIAGDTVSVHTLQKKKLIPRRVAKMPIIKILNSGKLSKKVIFSGIQFSDAALEKAHESGSTIQ